MEATFKVDGWSKLGRVSETESVLKAMLVDGFSPDCLTFSYLIEGLGRPSRIDVAVERVIISHNHILVCCNSYI